MRITTKDICRLASVSRGTVYRVINNKPNVLPETREAVLEVMRSVNYQPNLLGKALASRKAITLGVIPFPETHPFSADLARGFQLAEARYRDFGLTLRIRAPRAIEPAQQARAIRELIRAGVDGLALAGMDDPVVLRAVDDALARGIPVVTFNSAFTQDRQLCFVGENAFQSGQVAADLLARFVGGRGKIFVLNGSPHFAGHGRRVEGFQSALQTHYPGVQIVDIQACLDDEARAARLLLRALEAHPDLDGVYVVGVGTRSAAGLLSGRGAAGRVHLLCYDLHPENVRYLREDVVDAVITQDPVAQGYEPIKILFDLLFEGKAPERKVYHTRTEIITKHMLDADFSENGEHSNPAFEAFP